MRGIGLTFSRRPVARVFLAGAAILAHASLRSAGAETPGAAPVPEETAFAVPRVALPAGVGGVGLPQPLAPSEAARIRRIFALQRQGQLASAIALTARLNDTTLLGHILADRYLARGTRVPAPALADWLGRYADLPDACAIYAALLSRLPPGAAKPSPPVLPVDDTPAVPRGRASYAGVAQIRALFARGEDTSAQRLAQRWWQGSHRRDGTAAYLGGLAAWRGGRTRDAADLFEAAARSEGADAPLRAAAALWAARAHLSLGDGAGWRPWMLRAAAEPATLHGMIARRALGLPPLEHVAGETLGEADVAAVAALPQGRRAFALLQVGEPERAEAELRQLLPRVGGDPPLAHAVRLVAAASGLDTLSAELEDRGRRGELHGATPVLRPRGGFLLNPALVYAVARVESNFDPDAASAAGAGGLMQLMPGVAVAVASAAAVDQGGGAGRLRDPASNLRLGQQYLALLARADHVGDDLLRVLASYNAGPGAVAAWPDHADDPLLYLEAIPIDETRAFVQRILVNAWSYAAKFGRPAASLDALATGQRPLFSAEFAGGAPTIH